MLYLLSLLFDYSLLILLALSLAGAQGGQALVWQRQRARPVGKVAVGRPRYKRPGFVRIYIIVILLPTNAV